MNPPTARFRVHVDPANPGQFFACCALLELSARLPDNADAQGWFADGDFCVASHHNLPDTVKAIAAAELSALDASDETASPVWIGKPFDLRLDWWKSDDRKVTGLKVWAGRMSSLRIARAMQHTLREEAFHLPNLLNAGRVVPNPDSPLDKVEPFYFDARRGPNAHSRDTGFSTDALGLTTVAFPAVEFLCLVGLQRCFPKPADKPARHYDYFLWREPVESSLLLAAATGQLPGSTGYRFESWFRTSQRKHKAFLKANTLQPTITQP